MTPFALRRAIARGRHRDAARECWDASARLATPLLPAEWCEQKEGVEGCHGQEPPLREANTARSVVCGVAFRSAVDESHRAPEVGTALVEVLIAILIMGIGLLALLTLFPLGAIEMAQAIRDDRTAAVAADAVALGEAGEELVTRTMDFVKVSLAQGSADAHMAAQLREDYERLADQTEGLDLRLQELQQAFPRDEIQPYLGPLLAQLRSIKWRIVAVVHLLSLVESDERSQSSGRTSGYARETVVTPRW
jgi:uncharacterized membrane protein